MIGINLSLWSVALSRGGIAYEPEALALFARFTTQPTTARKGLINTLIKSLKTSGVWSKLDGLYLFAAHDAQAARRNWVQDLYNPAPVAAPVFTVDQGYQGDGSASYLDFGVVANALAKYTQNSATLGLWSRTDLPNGAATSPDLGHNTGYIGRSSGGSIAALRVNTSVGVSVPAGTIYPRCVAWSRTGATAWASYKNGAKIGTGADASAALGATAIYALRAGALGFSVNQLAAGWLGQGMTDADHLAVYGAINTYLQGTGAA